MNNRIKIFTVLAVGLLMLVAGSGCVSPSHADRGATIGGLLGAGTGAMVGKAAGNTAAGALLGAGIGAITGSAVGATLDEIEAENRARIAAQLGHQVKPGAVTVEDVIMLSQNGVDEQLIINHIQYNGVAKPLTADDLVLLKQNGVSPAIIGAMQQASQQIAAKQNKTVVVERQVAPPVVVEEYHFGPPIIWHHHPRPYWHRHGSAFRFGVTVFK